ncbi:hypothetical protein JR316_0010315 [Psilocybe cubensis]|uniref:Uncharacterized protein n=2 Tax=Psilocybe cubensis TaxID=181762 RepID=A0ACB8GRB8_PSICU|nr:hypothetical protein JR316_0010315 [Psilocybe cubensis]KAH9478078.1 hypothetical protein JR316_0010315 [Psilocybe cubensis]
MNLLDSLWSGLHVVESVRYGRLATVTIIFFDHLIMLDQEIDYIWTARWTVISILYILNRYYALVAAMYDILLVSMRSSQERFRRFSLYVFFNSNLSNSMYVVLSRHLVITDIFNHNHPDVADRCTVFLKWEGWTGLVFAMLGQSILQFRIYALYSGNRRVVVPMVTIFAVCSSISGWLMWKNISNSSVVSHNYGTGPFCRAIQGGGSTLYAFWIPVIVFETLLCLLALSAGINSFIQDGYTFRHSGRLLQILLRDSMTYFVVITGTAFACLLGAIINGGVYLESPVGFSVAMICTLGNRLILNIRDATRQRDITLRFEDDSLPTSVRYNSKLVPM